MYKNFMEFITAKEVDITSEKNDNMSKLDKEMLKYSEALETKRADMNLEIDQERTKVKNIEHEKEITTKKLREDKEKQSNLFRDEIKEIKRLYKEKKDGKQMKTKTTELVIKDTKAAFEENLKHLEELRNHGNENIFNIYENMHQALKDKLRSVEHAFKEKEKNFTKELTGLENKFEKNITELENTCNEQIDSNIGKKKEIETNITKIAKNNDNYEEKIKEWSKNLEELKINNSDLMESFLFNTLKLKQMNNLLADNEKLISNQEKIVKEKRSVNDKLEQLRYVLEYQITNLVKEKTPIEDQIKNFEELHNDFYQRFNLLYAEQLNIEDCIENNGKLIGKFKDELKHKKSSLYVMKNKFKAIDLVRLYINNY